MDASTICHNSKSHILEPFNKIQDDDAENSDDDKAYFDDFDHSAVNGKVITTEARGRKTKRCPDGPLFENCQVQIVKNKYIRLIGEYKNGQKTTKYDRTFEIGNHCKIGSYNLIYTGEIVGITEKSVTIIEHGQKKRLDLYSFAWRNWDYDAEKIAEHNNETMYYI